MTIKIEHSTVYRVSSLGSLSKLDAVEIRRIALENGYKSPSAFIRANTGKELDLDKDWRIKS